jgi:hypothetical protein
MDELIRKSVQEIALEGLRGCTPTQLYTHLQKQHDMEPDEFVKKKIFNLLRTVTELQFYKKQPDPKGAAKTTTTEKKKKKSEKTRSAVLEDVSNVKLLFT